ncbi:phage Gp37/Gp68 family protein [Nitrobacter winogradskyi]|uniref:Protein gp37 n=2 Tax=Nitrobacter winogradskyi TaxID=913 RepID=A0ACC6AEF2_NITWI|nr:phage Gp37/Gp68 family protein [Nitrobacter winogradskyi]MCP1998223.1 protein gp37 [Nitrobacter winogradskyi]GEC15189.1 hypothetical protein NWI01_10810 [Nitrobacter winogradskyi]
MSKTNIEWTERVWNPFAGCSIVSPGCTNCYAMKRARRIEACNAGLRQGHGGSPHYAGTTKIVNGNAVWTGKIGTASDEVLTAPLRRKKPTTYFVNSMSDLFHEAVPDEAIDKVFAVMALTPQHTYQVLTKRSARMRNYVIHLYETDEGIERLSDAAVAVSGSQCAAHIEDVTPPLPNVWLGVSTERQKEADERIPDLLATPAAVRFISAEPLLGPIDLTAIKAPHVPGTPDDSDMGWTFNALATGDYYRFKDDRGYNEGGDGPYREHALDWVIVGGESGAGARPMHPDWVRSLRDQCASAGVAFFFKQWGSWYPIVDRDNDDPDWRADYGRASRSPEKFRIVNLAGGCGFHGERVHLMQRYSKSAAGRLLDAVTHDAMPEATPL